MDVYFIRQDEALATVGNPGRNAVRAIYKMGTFELSRQEKLVRRCNRGTNYTLQQHIVALEKVHHKGQRYRISVCTRITEKTEHCNKSRPTPYSVPYMGNLISCATLTPQMMLGTEQHNTLACLVNPSDPPCRAKIAARKRQRVGGIHAQ